MQLQTKYHNYACRRCAAADLILHVNVCQLCYDMQIMLATLSSSINGCRNVFIIGSLIRVTSCSLQHVNHVLVGKRPA